MTTVNGYIFIKDYADLRLSRQADHDSFPNFFLCAFASLR